jgi:hypothetical protein
MRYVTAAIFAFGLNIGSGWAQEEKPQAPSSVDKGAAQHSGGKVQSPKTTGAMNNAADSLATSPQDVQRQQEGGKTAAEGGGERPGAPQQDISKQAPKTTGAAPGAK